MSTLHSSLYAIALASFALLLFGVGWQIKRERRRGAGQLFTLLLLLTLNFALEWRGTRFYDLVNRQRIRDAMTQLATCPDKPVLQIALEVGFNSKSTFNAAFRQHAEMTPSEFRAQQPRGSAPS